MRIAFPECLKTNVTVDFVQEVRNGEEGVTCPGLEGGETHADFMPTFSGSQRISHRIHNPIPVYQKARSSSRRF